MKYLFGIFVITLFLGTTSVALGADVDVSGKTIATTPAYTPMVGVPGLAKVSNYTAEMYVDALYKLAITVGGILAVIQIIFGGVMYMFDGSITNKEAGKDKIKGALFGLLIILGAVLLLQTINPDLLKLKIFNNAPSIDTIVTTRNTPAPVEMGGKVLATAEGLKRMQDTCKGNVVKEQVTASKGAKMEFLACYAKPEEINAGVGGTFESSLYNPAEKDAALKNFENSCKANGGVYQPNLVYSNTCDEKTNVGTVEIGSSLNLFNKTEAQKEQARIDYKQACTGTVSELNTRAGTTLTCKQ